MISDHELNPAAVEIGRFFPQPPDAVWRALTEPELIERWLMRSNGFAATVGTHFIFVVPTEPTGEIACEVLVVQPGEQLTHTWVDLRAKYPARWVVDWTIKPQGRGTRLLLTQTGFDIENRRQKMARNYMERGWKTTLLKLREVLEN
ncbi:SRPBCC domain-containing protein [Nocardia uniformis]|uniref:SRPBCC domain-containing protein n=1 Tax=Nocardia uniformis TaxID=53432 RepID=A0A849C6T8_9NOCA|nr:SRPBCC domain-containing protein [Nocardia uniformis]NNH71557.1 SRPBCC domain-containing protein [Nocardia uniformis]